MQKSKILFLLSLSILLGSCSKFTTRMRVKPQLVYENGLLISNSQTNPYYFHIENNSLSLIYKIIVKNNADKSAELNLEQAYYQAGDEKNNLDCKTHLKKEKELTLKKDEQTSIECFATITPNPINKLSLNDTDIKIVIPLDKNIHTFTYRVFAEEFTK